MTLTDELLKADASKASNRKTGTFKSKRLAMIMGKKEPVEVKIQEIGHKRFIDLMKKGVDKEGNPDYKNLSRAQCLLILEGVVEPKLKDQKLVDHFGVSDGGALVEKLFSNEIAQLYSAIVDLCGYEEEDAENEETIKN